MKTPSALIFLNLILFCNIISAATITHKEITQNEYVFSLVNESFLEINEAQQLIYNNAVSVCKEKNPLYGKYKFNGSQPVSDTAKETPYFFDQHIKCVEKNQKKAIKTPFALTNTDRENIKKAVKSLTNNYFMLKETGEYEKAYGMLTGAMQEVVKFNDWKNKESDYFSETGALVNRGDLKTTIYNNPDHSPQPGIYVAVDYETEYENYVTQCGYVIWYRPDNNDLQYKVMREEYGHITKEILSQLKSNELSNMRKQIKCK